ncbi:MAG TPA: ATP-binding protein [Rhabdochlamydiaceae bacterium]|nr:ATP-binding protein [Rhabdochlamydiaceae bacterium]
MLIAREKEREILNKLLKSKKAELLAMYGRRRIGKTFLLDEFYRNQGVYLTITGTKDAPKSEQIKNFYRKMRTLFPNHSDEEMPKDWSDAFDLLRKEILKIGQAAKFILFLDELPWLASPKSGLLPSLEYFWNEYLSRMPNVLLIICGSAAHWMIKKIIQNKGGLHGRLSAQIRLEAFNLSETEYFLMESGIHLKRKQLIELYMVFGGIAKYLTYVPPGKSPGQIINELCFSSSGPLFSEFTQLYSSLFDSAEKHITIIRALAKKQKGLTLEDLIKATNLTRGGGLTDILLELEESGFIMTLPAFGKHSKDRIYRLVDEYSFFYLSWIEEVKSSVLRNFDKEYWNKVSQTPAWHSWAGHMFENICLKHSGKIKEALGLAGITTHESHWQHFAKGKTRGAQIDLVIDRADNCINLCEIKFCNDEYKITKAYAEDLERKKKVFQEVTGTPKTIFLTLITPFGVKQNTHSIGIIDQQLTMNSLFDSPERRQ